MYQNQHKTKRNARHHLARRQSVEATTSRSGFVLILVIVMLGLLAIVGVSFTHFATQEVQSASARDQGFSHHEEQGSVEQQLDSGLASVLVGSNNLHDFTHGHEILRDLYGGDGQQVMVRLVAQPPVKGVTRLRLDVDPTVKVPYFLMPLPGYYNGRQLVFGSGRFKGTSVRILNSDLINASNASNPSIETILVDVDSSFDFVSQDIGRVIGDAVIIGRPFNGGGMGVYPQGGVHFSDANNDQAADDAISVVGARGAVSPYLDAIDVPDGLQDRFSPNFFYSGQRPESVWVPDTPNGVLRLIPYGGFDEDYDYPDFQNMFLGLVRHRLERTGTDGLGQPVLEPAAVVEQPSFHRPGMIAKLRQSGIDPWRHPVGRKLMLRPRPVDQRQPGINGFYGDPLLLTERDGSRWNDIPHPGYDGVFGTPDDLHPGVDGMYQSIADDGTLIQTNGAPIGDDRYFPEGFPAPYSPGLDLVYGTVDDASDQDGDGVLDGYRTPALPLLSPTSPARWVLDVDNDGDGMVDGVWVDLGKPVRTTTDGRRIKPLYSFLIVDLDSKLNLNAHGQLNRDQFNNASGAGGVQGTNPNVVDNLADSHLSVHPSINPVLPNDDLPVGSGWSVAEINLQNVFPQAGTGNLSRANLEYLQVLAGKVGNPHSEPPRKIVKGRYGEYNMLWDQDSDDLPDQDINGDSRVDYPGPGYSQLYPQFSDQVKWDDDRPGDWYTRLVYAGLEGGNYTTASRFHGDVLEGTVWKPILNGVPTGDFIPRWYRNPPDFDGDGTVRMNTLSPTFPGGGLMMGWPSYGPSPDGAVPIGGTTPLELTWGWGGQLLDLGLENEKGWGVINPNNQTWRPGERGSENSNEPDEINLVRRQDAPDAIYGAEDLSWLHLAHDLSGSELVSRLSELAPFTFGTARYSDTNDPIRPLINRFAAHNRRLVTTDSWDLAGFSAPPASDADWLPANWGGGDAIQQIFRPGQGSGTPGVGSVTGNFLSGGEADKVAARLFFQIVPDEIKAGFRLDLNRPLGDGIDNPTPGAPDGNGVIDEDLEAGFDTIDNDGDGYNNEQRGEPGAIGPGFPDGRDNDGDALIDEADELVEDIRGPGSNVSITEPRKHVPGPRQRFARDLYILLYLVAMNPGADRMMGTVDDTPRFSVPPGFIRMDLIPVTHNISAGAADYLAQLAVNIVDFRDADSLMTGFEYDRWPGGGRGWDVNGNLIHDGDLQNNSYPPELDYYTARGVVWGVEKPELLINETLSFYDTRNQEELDDEIVDETDPPVVDYDQSYVWVELYNPNDPNHPGYPSIDLSEMAPRGVDPVDRTDEVWRLVVSQPAGPLPSTVMPPAQATTQSPSATGKPYLNYDVQTGNRPVKVVFRASPPVGTDNQASSGTINSPNQNSAKFGSASPATGFVLPGNQYLSVGSQALIGTGSLIEHPNAWPNSQYVVNQERDLAGALPPDSHLDSGLMASTAYLASNPPRRGAYLQRLADPTRPWHEQANPYVTIDAMQLKVYVLDSTDRTDPQDELSAPLDSGPLRSFERLMPFVGRARDILGSQDPILSSPDDPQGARDALGDDNQVDTLGVINAHTMSNGPAAGQPFPWFAFQDRMFATPTELMQVPGTRPERLTNEFSTYLAINPASVSPPAEFYRPLDNPDTSVLDPSRPPKPFPHLVQWLASDVKTSQQSVGQTRTGLYRFFEFVEVPSRFNGVDENRNADSYQPPYHYRRGHRVPGKVNLNTVYEPEVFAATFNNHPGIANNQSSSVLWNNLKAGDDSNLALPGKDLRRDGWSVNNPQVPGTLNFWATGDDRPFRSYAFGASPQGDIHDTLFRELRLGLQPTDPSSFLFDWLYPSFVTQQPEWGDTTPGQHTSFRFQLLQKLGNAVTTRSNVFAIWVTVGYFEVLHEPQRDGMDNDGDVFNQQGELVGISDEPDELLPRLGQELGYQTGEVTRHRAFYVVDRSRSSGWHPELEIDPSEMILVRKIIE